MKSFTALGIFVEKKQEFYNLLTNRLVAEYKKRTLVVYDSVKPGVYHFMDETVFVGGGATFQSEPRSAEICITNI